MNPDEFYVFKPTLEQGKRPILKRQLGTKHQKMVYAPAGSSHPTHNIPTTEEEFQSFSLTDEEVLTLARYAILIERHYTKEAGEYRPMDMEWAKDGVTNELFIVQARPETVQSQKMKKGGGKTIEKFYFVNENEERSYCSQARLLGARLAMARCV